MIKLKRAYEPYDDQDGYRILIDRLWPRGVSKEEAKIDQWVKGIAPSAELRKWFSHDESKWPEFKQKYFKELESAGALVQDIIEKQRNQTVTLVYATKDEKDNNAIALKEYIEEQEKKE